YGEKFAITNKTVQPRSNIISAVKGDALDIHAVIEPGTAESFGFVIRKGGYETSGTPVHYDAKNNKLSVLGKTVDLEPVNGKIELRILADRASLAVFANGGKISLSGCFIPVYTFNDLEFFCEGGNVKVENMEIYKLRSAWQQ